MTASPKHLSVSAGLLAVVSVAIMDALAKALGGTYSAAELTFFRFTFGLLPMLLLLPFGQGSMRSLAARPVAQIARGGLMFGGAVLFFTGLKYLTLAEATSILFAEPFIVLVLAAVFLKEKITLGHALSTTVGLCGVLIILRPGSSVFRSEALLPLGAAALSAIWVIVSRSLAKSDNAGASTAIATFSAALFSLALLPDKWPTPPASDLLLLACLGGFGCLSTYLYSFASAGLRAATIAIIDYTILAWAVLFGILLWNEVPDSLALTGCALIVGSGLLGVVSQSREPS